jgi:hypothetical protein
MDLQVSYIFHLILCYLRLSYFTLDNYVLHHFTVSFPILNTGSEHSIFESRSYVEHEFQVELIIEFEVVVNNNMYRTVSSGRNGRGSRRIR